METVLLFIIAAATIALAVVRLRNQSGQPSNREAASQGESSMARNQGPKPPAQVEPEATLERRAPTLTQSSVSAPEVSTQPPPFERTARGAGLFDGVRTWGYQLQHVNMKEVAASSFDVMVIDYSKDGSDEQAFTPGDIARMKSKPDGSRRQVLAYMSIGEAESYRYYWDPAWSEQKPTWLLSENPAWKENFSVCYWDLGWQAQFCGNPSAYLDKIMAAGFDGVYLDKCDVFEDLQNRDAKVAQTRSDLEGDMVNFIVRLAHYAKTRKPTFAIVMQNAEALLESEQLREALDGVAKESLLFGMSSPEKPNPKDEVTYARRALELVTAAGRTVFVVEYLSDADKIREATTTIDGFGFLSTISAKNRKLNHLNPDPALA